MVNNFRMGILASLFAILTAVGALIRIPFPMVPLSLQTLMVILAGLVLGSRYGALSQVIYIMLGLMGLPVFTGGGGIHYIFHPTFGFLLGFIAGAWLAGSSPMRKRKGPGNYIIKALLATAGIYLCGILCLYLNLNFLAGKPVTLFQAVQIGMIPFIPGDILKILAASFLASRIIPFLEERGFLGPVEKMRRDIS